MAITNNVLLSDASGKVGSMIVFKKYRDKTVVSKKLDMSNRVLNEKQLESNERLRLANIYAQYHYSGRAQKPGAQKA